jgi:hypothetical protein|tara:strand:+ start:71 stop:550 length:480 start_codon:yes stop_codon:yes gene_type:complete
MSKRITLNSAEQIVCKQLALMRYEIARAVDRKDQQIGNQPSWQTDEDGIGGEIAASRLLNVYPSLVLKPDAGWDVMYRGKRIDIKTTRYKSGRLLAKLNARDDEVDVYLLVTGTFPEYDVVGYALKDSLLSPKNVIDLGHGRGYGLSQDKLTPIEKLIG